MPSLDSTQSRIAREGQPVTLSRRRDDGSLMQATVAAFVRNFSPESLGEGMLLGDRVLHIAAPELARAGWSDAPRKPDLVDILGKTTVVQTCETRFLRGRACVYIVQVRGG